MRNSIPRLRPVHPGYVVFGLDHHEHTRAAWFSPRERVLARLASNMAGFSLFEPLPNSPARVEDWLPRGTRLESGRFVIPRVRQGLYQKLLELEEISSRTHVSASAADDSSGRLGDADPDLTQADEAE